MSMRRVCSVVFITLLFIMGHVSAHPGGRDANGCHVCRSNCAKHGLQTGEKHCHTAAAPKPAPASIPPSTEIVRLDYEGFTVWIDCASRGAIKFRYNAQRDWGAEKRLGTFSLDPDVPESCQQISTASYKTEPPAPHYDRGHLVPANHLDSSRIAIRQSNFMTNILPQVSTMNRGAWLRTEEIVECYRDFDELLVIGGVFWGTNTNNDHFIKTHGIETPDSFWKVVIRGDGRVAAWIIPNSVNATRKNLDQFLVSVREIEQQTGESIPVDEFRKDEVLSASWPIPIGCDKG